MKIAQLTPGSGDNFYCENCLRDLTLVKAMRGLGHDVLMIPMYLPLQSETDEKVADSPLFFGGVNVYLQQKFEMFRKTPRWVDKMFDRQGLLEWVGKKAHMTSARDLGETTLSMLRGENGRQVKELERLVKWLGQKENKPDVVVLSNALLAGLAKSIKAKLGVAVVCLLQDEDGFLDGLAEPYRERAWEEIRKRAKDVDGFIAVSEYYADVMRERLGIENQKVHVVYTGISLEEYEDLRLAPAAATIGYLSRMCADKGLDVLAEAFIKLKGNEKLRDLRLRIAGGKSGNDKAFINKIKGRIRKCGYEDDVEFLEDFGGKEKVEFLKSLSVLSVPERKAVAYGLYVVEAMAAGVPVIQPKSGMFVELLEMTGGGILYEPGDESALAAALEKVLVDTDYARELGSRGREKVFEMFNIERNAEEMVEVFEKVASLERG